MFEQSMLAHDPTNKSWSFLASLSAEAFVVGVLIIIPLIYGDHLPDFHWKYITVGPPVRPVQPRQVPVRAASGPTRPVFIDPPRIANPIVAPAATQAAYSSSPVDVPPGIQEGSDGGAPVGPILFEQTERIRPPKPVVPVHPQPQHDPVRVSQGVQMAKLIRRVMPVYPALARNVHISGVVHLVGIIAKDGTIKNLQLISGHPLLTRAAIDAVSQWVYQPTLLSGEPVEVICPIDVNFTLNQ
jgi:protein TonB